MAFVQYCIAILLNSLYKANKNVFGFVNGKSIVDNATKHVNKQFILNIDLKDFFNTISEDVIIEKLIRQPYYFSYRASKLISDIVTVQLPNGIRCLPQGAPSSPILTNIVADHMDVRLSNLCEKYGLIYSRYADDITISFDLPELKKMRRHGFIENGLRDIIEDIIISEGFEINQKKNRFSFPNQQHEVTGLIVNKKVNVRREYIKKIRTEIHNWEVDGFIKASYKFFQYRIKNNNTNYLPSMEKVIKGKLSFLKMVKGADDSTYRKLLARYNVLCNRDNVFIKAANIDFNNDRPSDNIFDVRPPKRNILKKKDENKKYPRWEEVIRRPFTDKEKNLILSSEVVSGEFSNSVKFRLRNGKVKYIGTSIDTRLSLYEEVNLEENKILVLSNGIRFIYRIV